MYDDEFADRTYSYNGPRFYFMTKSNGGILNQFIHYKEWLMVGYTDWVVVCEKTSIKSIKYGSPARILEFSASFEVSIFVKFILHLVVAPAVSDINTVLSSQVIDKKEAFIY